VIRGGVFCGGFDGGEIVVITNADYFPWDWQGILDFVALVISTISMAQSCPFLGVAIAGSLPNLHFLHHV
jgi:hypothetical protein